MTKEEIIENVFPPEEFVREYSASELKHFCNRVAEWYAKEKCKEQRELCQECVDDGYFEMTTAPEPKFD